MKLNRYFSLLALSVLLLSCGAEHDAKDVCSCYKEVVGIKDDAEAEAKMTECLEMLNKYVKKHDEDGTKEEFMKAYNHCR